MIETTRLNGAKIYVNPHLIESMEEIPDTRLNFITGKVLLVGESTDVIMKKIIDYRKKLGINSQET
ncbi:MAG: flagellar protein FlbD [Spirochaetae bacterium HGW-Spirochaetae-6]|jgi:flagellar protein FlbD|nr:MAG: flagellar protein FlbD [Spirochaetae bacterium HGW-Spirochaetae-6]